MSQAEEIVASASTAIVLDHPFFASLLLQMPRIEDPLIETACTNGVVIRYNPAFIESLTPTEVAGLLVHEVMHPALGHLHRLPATVEGNIAGDYAINNFLDNYNQGSDVPANRRLDLPQGGLIDHKLDALSAEEILKLLRQNKLSVKVVKVPMRGAKDGGWGEFEEQVPSGEMSAGEMGAEWERRVVRAATAARMQQGNLPGCIQRLVDAIVNPTVPWQRLLERFVDNTAATDYSWSRPDRRFLPEDILIPEIHDTTLGEIVVAVDTSGSIFSSKVALASFEAEINSIIGNCRPLKVTLIYCDAQVTQVDEYGCGEPIKIKAKGGGGTDFRPVGDHINRHNITPRVCIYLTDLEGTFPKAPWDFPTIWCVYDNEGKEAPFGDTVHIPKMK
jgi:predicted metal-dependent peptidase